MSGNYLQFHASLTASNPRAVPVFSLYFTGKPQVDCTPSVRHETRQTFARLYMRSPCLVREGLGPALSRGLRRARRCGRLWRDISARARACSVARAGTNRSPPRSVFASGRGRGAKGHQSPGTWPPGSSNLPSNPASLAVEGPFYPPPPERPMSATLIPGHGHCPRAISRPGGFGKNPCLAGGAVRRRPSSRHRCRLVVALAALPIVISIGPRANIA